MPYSNPHTSGPRLRPRLKWVWSGGRINARWRLGLFGFYERVHGFPDSGFAINVSRLLKGVLLLVVVGYVSGAGALTVWFSRRPYNQIGFIDVLVWPVRREEVARLRGQSWLAQGAAALRESRWPEGVFLLNRGLQVCPDAFEARVSLAEFHVVSGQRGRAVAVLAAAPAGLTPPKASLGPALALLEAGEDWELVLRFCELGLAAPRETSRWEERQSLLARKAAALIATGRAAEAIALAEIEGDAAGVDLKLQRALGLLAQARAEAASALLSEWSAGLPRELRPPFLRLLARAAREAGQFEKMEQALADLRALHPSQPEPLAYAVEQRVRAGRGGDAALADYLFRFGNKPANLLLVARPLANIPATDFVRQIVAAARERGQPLRPVQTSLAHSLLQDGEWQELSRLIEVLAPQFVGAEPEPDFWFQWISSLAAALVSPAQAPQDALVEFMRGGVVSLEARCHTLASLRRAGLHATATEVLASSRKFFPSSRSLQAEEVALQRALAAAPTPAQAALITLTPRMTEEPAEFFREVDAAIAAARWAAARELLQKLRVARLAPEWVGAQEGDILWREVRVAQGLQDSAALRLAAQLYINSEPRAKRVLELARELHGAGAREDAVLLAKTVLRRLPEQEEAMALLAEWQPRRGGAR